MRLPAPGDAVYEDGLIDTTFVEDGGRRFPLKTGLPIVVEIQLLLPEWLASKKRNSVQYKVTRAVDVPALTRDFAKPDDYYPIQERGSKPARAGRAQKRIVEIEQGFPIPPCIPVARGESL